MYNKPAVSSINPTTPNLVTPVYVLPSI